MNITFSPLATVAPMHPYYTDVCRDIEFVPTSATADCLRAGRSIARMRDGALHLLYEADAPDVPVSSLAGTTLHFGMRLVNPYFANFTEPVIAAPATQATPLYANGASPTTLDAPVASVVSAGIHVLTPTDTDRPLDVVVRTLTGQTVANYRMDAGQDTVSLDLRSLTPGRYFVDEEKSGMLSDRHLFFVDRDLRDYGAWGVLALTVDAGFYAAPPHFEIAFNARQETLRYYVVAANFLPAEFDQLGISDLGFAAEGRSEIGFDKVLPPFPPDCIDANLLTGGGAQIALFQSQNPVARKERGLKKLRLSRSSTAIIENLPLPGPEKAQADLIVHLSKP